MSDATRLLPVSVRANRRSRDYAPRRAASAWRRALPSCERCSAAPDSPSTRSVHVAPSREPTNATSALAADPQGRALLAEQPSLLAALSHRAALARMPEASLAHAYLAYLERNGFEPGGLLALEHRVQAQWQQETGQPALDPLRAWFKDRSLLVHDLFHLLTAYGTDVLGEATAACLLVRGQFGRLRPGLLTAGASFEVGCVRSRGWRFLATTSAPGGACRRAVFLMDAAMGELLPLTARDGAAARAESWPPDQAHPRGILRRNRRRPRGALGARHRAFARNGSEDAGCRRACCCAPPLDRTRELELAPAR